MGVKLMLRKKCNITSHIYEGNDTEIGAYAIRVELEGVTVEKRMRSFVEQFIEYARVSRCPLESLIDSSYKVLFCDVCDNITPEQLIDHIASPNCKTCNRSLSEKIRDFFFRAMKREIGGANELKPLANTKKRFLHSVN